MSLNINSNMTMKNFDLSEPKTIVFDLDGTLLNVDRNYYDKATPIKHRINMVNKLYDEGHTIIIETARGCVSGKNYFFYTLDQLKEFGLKFHTLRTGVKYGADLFVDDKGISDNNFFKDNGKGKKLEPWQYKDRD